MTPILIRQARASVSRWLRACRMCRRTGMLWDRELGELVECPRCEGQGYRPGRRAR